MKTGRNDPCPCGSGKKYKRCCEAEATERTTFLTKWMFVLLGAFLLLGAVGIIASILGGDPSDAPPGRVWSPEHGHWHEIR